MRIWRMFKSPRPIFNVGRKLKCCSFTFWTDSHQKEILPQVTSSNSNSLLSCNSINTPSTLTMGSQGFSLWLALVGAMQGKMAVQGSQALRLPRFNILDGRAGLSSAAPVTQTNGICKINAQTKSPTKRTALLREHNFGVAGQTV